MEWLSPSFNTSNFTNELVDSIYNRTGNQFIIRQLLVDHAKHTRVPLEDDAYYPKEILSDIVEGYRQLLSEEEEADDECYLEDTWTSRSRLVTH